MQSNFFPPICFVDSLHTPFPWGFRLKIKQGRDRKRGNKNTWWHMELASVYNETEQHCEVTDLHKFPIYSARAE